MVDHVELIIDYNDVSVINNFILAFEIEKKKICKMATGSMCMMQCKVKRWGCDDDIDDDKMIKSYFQWWWWWSEVWLLCS